MIAFDAVVSSGLTGVQNPSWTHIPVGTPMGILVYIAVIQDNVTACTYGGVPMSQVSGSPNVKGTTEAGGVICYFLGSGIPTGNQTVQVTGTIAQNRACVSISFTGAADTEVVDTDVSIFSNSISNPSATLSLAGRDCHCSIGFFSGTSDPTQIAPLTNWTSMAETDFGPAMGGFYRYDIVGTTDVTIGWTQTADDAVAIGVAVSEVIGGVVGNTFPVGGDFISSGTNLFS